MKEPVITRIQPDSIAMELGITPGDRLVSMNGQPVLDIFDYRFHAADAELTLRIRKPDGQEWVFEVEKEEAEDPGLVFENPLIEREHGCTNQCVFCFVDQLPRGMRSSLYFKDDDARLSFLYGNYITMTNMKDQELDRIIRYRMSPINVSVHTTNPALRVKMLGNRFAGNILERVKRLVEAGITVNAQIVLCRGWNDGEELERTLADLTALAPRLHSISVVPIGLTRFREGLPVMKPFEKSGSREVIATVNRWQQALLERVDTRTVYAADEFYLLAEMEIPDVSAYEDFPQIENGVGMLASFADEFEEELAWRRSEGTLVCCHGPGGVARRVSVATGTSAAPMLKRLAARLTEACGESLLIHVYPCENRFFGGHVNVTGLLTGSDLLAQLADSELGEALLLPRSMFRADSEIMLDDVTRAQLVESLKVPIRVVDMSGGAFLAALLGVDGSTGLSQEPERE